jgi:2-polyprenyl-3-methyl-5-hydroxy-6-metoxy-1,4-benzoquinol methylase
MFKDFLNKGVLPFKNAGTALDFGSGPVPVLSGLIKRDYQFSIDYYDLHYQPEKSFENKKYDVILSTEVIEHVNNPIEIFSLLHDHLNEGGILSVMTLFHEKDEASFIKWWYRRDETHISFYTLKTLQLIAEKVGFEIIYTDNKRICTFKKIAT